ncbi:hypothetical protein KR093_005900, partial [Drosophila rubida]
QPFEKILNNYYYIAENTSSWFAAMHKCREFGADLVNFETRKDFEAVRNNLSKKKCYWIGLSNLSEDGEYHSITTGLSPSFTMWNTNEPNNKNGNEHCAQLIDYSSVNLKMNDNHCLDLCLFICQTKLPHQINFVIW